MNTRKFALALILGGMFVSGPTMASQAEPESDYPAVNFSTVGLVRTVVENAFKYRDINKALADGYVVASGCVSGEGGGAMGVHYARPDLIGDGMVDATKPELLVYEPKSGSAMRLVAVEYLVIKDAWEANNGVGTPVIIEGQHGMLMGAPNRYGLPPHFMLHVWAFKNNQSGVFAPWNPRVTCEFYNPV